MCILLFYAGCRLSLTMPQRTSFSWVHHKTLHKLDTCFTQQLVVLLNLMAWQIQLLHVACSSHRESGWVAERNKNHLSHASCQRDGRNTPGLSADDVTSSPRTLRNGILQQELRDLRAFAAACNDQWSSPIQEAIQITASLTQNVQMPRYARNDRP